ncbi:MAG: hypothetical protein EXX96DRAFT_613772 [Benjaminiella poitrasii]|nr:MAG: hypothetical protein EXX96DRAFT_613772 [Benjaminiella poitrasii]
MSPQVDDPVLNLINRLPHTPPTSHNTRNDWQMHWTALQRLLYQLDMTHQHI